MKPNKGKLWCVVRRRTCNKGLLPIRTAAKKDNFPGLRYVCWFILFFVIFYIFVRCEGTTHPPRQLSKNNCGHFLASVSDLYASVFHSYDSYFIHDRVIIIIIRRTHHVCFALHFPFFFTPLFYF